MGLLRGLRANRKVRAPRQPRQKPSAEPVNANDSLPIPFKYAGTADLGLLSLQCQSKFGVTPRQFQLDAAAAILAGKDCVINVPTGGGKTLAFYLPLLAEPDAVILVVSPLTALMIDQVSLELKYTRFHTPYSRAYGRFTPLTRRV